LLLKFLLRSRPIKEPTIGVPAEKVKISHSAIVHMPEPVLRHWHSPLMWKKQCTCASANNRKTNHFATEVTEICSKKLGRKIVFALIF
jgi:hypothetical protein